MYRLTQTMFPLFFAFLLGEFGAEALHGRFNNPPPLVDPILCSLLFLETKPTPSDNELLYLCRNNNVNEDDGNGSKNFSASRSGSGSGRRAKRQQARSRLQGPQMQVVLDLHNSYRRQTKPPSADMQFLKWSDELAGTAQQWADNCEFVHGKPEGSDINFGQNLYVGPDATGYRAIKLWFDEQEFYDYAEDECDFGEQCGHFVQLAWSITEYVGCAVAKCRAHGFLYVCHYLPRGNHPDVWPYRVGVPCSQCLSRSDGGLCNDKLCASKADCGQLHLNCTCDLQCHNCGIFNAKHCRCFCKPGWDTLDCSWPCTNSHDFCAEDPGWPNVLSCPMEDYKVRDEFCRKMCKQCQAVDDSSMMSGSSYCCGGVVCEEGDVLDTVNGTCECHQLCPGPTCFPPREVADDHGDEESDNVTETEDSDSNDYSSADESGDTSAIQDWAAESTSTGTINRFSCGNFFIWSSVVALQYLVTQSI